MKKRKTILTVVSIFLALGVVAGVASIFSLHEDDYTLSESPLGYMDGTTLCTGEYFSNSDTFTFAASDIDTIVTDNNAASNNANRAVTIINSAVEYDGDNSESYYAYPKDDAGNTYLELGMGTEESPNSATVAFPYEYVKGQTGSDYRAGTYIAEFDFKLAEPDYTNCIKDDKFAVIFGLYTYISPGPEGRYLHWMVHDVEQEGCYIISPWGYTSSAVANSKALLKYGEWYNIRLEMKLDSSEQIATTFYINGECIEFVLSNYSSVQNNGKIPTLSPCCFVVALQKSCPGTVVSIDNVYTSKIN